MSFLRGVFGSQQNPNPNQRGVPPSGRPGSNAPVQSPPVPFNAPAPGFAPPPHSTAPGGGRPTPQVLASARQQRQAELAGAVFGGPPAPLAQSTVQPRGGFVPQQRAPGFQQNQQQQQQQIPVVQQQQHGGFVGTPGGPSPPPGVSSGDMDDMFGGLDVKAAEAPVEVASSFSFLSDDSESVPVNHYDTPTPISYESYSVPTPSSPQPTANIDANRLSSSKSHVDRCLSGFWQEWKAMIATESQLKQEEVQLQLGIRRDIALVKETEEKQASAVANEEYEKADTYNAEMERLHRAIKTAQDRLIRIRQEIDHRGSHKQQSAHRIISLLADTTQQFTALSSTKAAELSTFISTQVNQLTTKDTQINNDLDRVNTSLSRTQGDLDSIHYEDEGITRSLNSETHPFIDEKETLSNQEHRLVRELEELKRQVVLKEREIVENREKQHSADRAVEVIRAKHQQQRLSLTEKRNKVDLLRSRDVGEKRDIEQRKAALDAEIEINKKLELEYRTHLHDVAVQLAHTTYLTQLIQQEEKQRQDYHQIYAEDQAKIAALQHELNNYEQNLNNIKTELANVEQQVENHRSNINTVTNKIPAMESEKNAAVAARDFKKAAAASKEIKTLQQSKTDSETAIDELKVQVQKHSETLATADQKKLQIQQDIIRLEDELDHKRLHYLLLNQRKLQQRQQRTTATLQAQNTGSKEQLLLVDHLQKEIDCIDVELSWIAVEIRELRGKHDWDESIGRLGRDEELYSVEESVVENHVHDPSPFDSVKKGSTVNGDAASFGIPTISTAVHRSNSSSLSTSLSSPRSKPTAADLRSLQSTLQTARDQLAEYEGKVSIAVENEDFETADSLTAAVDKEKRNVEKLEQREKQMKQIIGEEENKQQEDPLVAL